MNRATTVFLSPHHDDILLSLPGRLLSSPDEDGSARVVVVVFSEETAPMTVVCSERHRHAGVAVVTLGFEEARRRGVSLRSCLRSGRVLGNWSLDDDAFIDALAASLRSAFSRIAPNVVFAPLMPLHVDHALVRTAAERLADECPPWRLRYYEDQPYCALAPCGLRKHSSELVPMSADTVPWSSAAIQDFWRPLRHIVGPRDLARVLRYWIGDQTRAHEPFEPPFIYRRAAFEA